MTKDEALDRLEEAELGLALYRTARRILDRVSEADGRCYTDLATARWICGTDSDETVRGHLSRLAATGLIRRVAANGAIHIQWCDWDGEEGASQRAEIARQRAESARQEAQERAESARQRAESTRQRAESARQEADQRAESARQRAEIAQERADSARCENENQEPVYIVTTTTVVVDNNNNNNNNCDSSSSSSAPTASAVTEPQQPALPAAVAPPVSAIAPADWARVRAVYESDFGLFTGLLVERVQDALRQHSAEMVVLAMGRAVSANKRRWDYVEGILRNWAVEGYGNAGAKNAAVGTAAESRGAGRSGGAAGANSAGRQEAPAPEGLREWLIATGQVPAIQGAD